jgi:hypothetical protein
MTRSLTMRDYLVKEWNVQRLVERVFSSCSCSKILGGRTGGIRLVPRPRDYGALYGTHVTDGLQKSHRVSGRYAVPGVLMLLKSSSTRTRTIRGLTKLLPRREGKSR